MTKSTSLSDYPGQRIHFIGIGGSSMSGLAELVRGRGYLVTGSDRVASHATDRLKAEGIPVAIGHAPGNVEGAALAVYTAAIAPDNCERVACESLGIPSIERAELLGQLSASYGKSIAVCGTHGKTTATSMLSLVLLQAGLDPTIHIGGEMDAIGGSVRSGGSDLFITEACEFKASFLTLYPTLAFVLNVDADHLDFYRDIEHIQQTFAKFLSQLRPGGLAVLCGDNARARALGEGCPAAHVTYGLDTACDYTAKDLRCDTLQRYSFTPLERGEPLSPVALSVPGRHNALNALGVVACARALQIPARTISQALAAFKGAHRRFEHTGTVQGVQLYHDYGHNPAEFKTVIPLAAALPHRKLFVVCQPHTYSRTKRLFADYLTCFDGADEVLVTDIYAAREKDPGDIHATMLVGALKARGVPVAYTPDFNACQDYLTARWQPGDVVLTLGCGNINLLNEQLAKVAPMSN